MSHHYSGPDFGFPRGDARLDLTDLYAFPKPGDAGKSILIMDVHPSAAKNPPGPTTAELIRTAIPSPISPTACGSRRPKVEHRPRRCAASRARKPPGRATAGKPSSSGRRSRQDGRRR